MKAILAVDSDWGIGKDGKIPWHLHMDMLHFNAYTRNKICLMGKTTYESIPEKNYTRLPTRKKIILSHNTTRIGFDRCQYWAENWYEASRWIETFTHTPDRSDVILIGGKSMYDRLLPYCDEIMVTHIDHSFDCDTLIDSSVVAKIIGLGETYQGMFAHTRHIADITEDDFEGKLIRYHIEKYTRINPLDPAKVPDDLRLVLFPS